MATRKRSPMNGYYALRWHILARDNFTCQYCGQKAPDVKLEVDHVIPVEQGGGDEPENLKTSCWACNKGKASLSIMVQRRKAAHPIATPITIAHSSASRILDFLTSHPGLTAPAIAQALALDKSLVRMSLNRMQKRGLARSGHDRGWIPTPRAANAS